MKKYLLLIALAMNFMGFSQEKTGKKTHFFNQNMDYQVRTHFSIGGSSPFLMPREIRKIITYNPTLVLGLEANATKWFSSSKRWGVRIGASVETKGMKTRALVRNYYTEVAQNEEKIKGYFTGEVLTDAKNAYFTAPFSLLYKKSERLSFFSTIFLSGLMDGGFKGQVSNGYLRQNTPVGEKILFEEEGSAQYDFSEEVRKFQWGASLGSEYFLTKHFLIFGEMTFGISPLLNNNFEAISFPLHNIYLKMGFGHRF